MAEKSVNLNPIIQSIGPDKVVEAHKTETGHKVKLSGAYIKQDTP